MGFNAYVVERVSKQELNLLEGSGNAEFLWEPQNTGVVKDSLFTSIRHEKFWDPPYLQDNIASYGCQ